MGTNLVVNVTGTAYNNADGSNRQQILKHTKAGESVKLTHKPIEQDENAVAVIRMNGNQIGWLHRSTAKIIASILDSGRTVDAQVEEVIAQGKNFLECRIAITNPDIIAEIKSGYEKLSNTKEEQDKLDAHNALASTLRQATTPKEKQEAIPPSKKPADGNMEVTSVCVKCQFKNKHEVDNNGEADVTCKSCSTVYKVQSYEVRAKGGQRDRSTHIKNYSIRVKKPDGTEALLRFSDQAMVEYEIFDSSKHEIEMMAGDRITLSYMEGKLKYLLNQKIDTYWDLLPPRIPLSPTPRKQAGCSTIPIALLVIVVGIIMLVEAI